MAHADRPIATSDLSALLLGRIGILRRFGRGAKPHDTALVQCICLSSVCRRQTRACCRLARHYQWAEICTLRLLRRCERLAAQISNEDQAKLAALVLQLQ